MPEYSYRGITPAGEVVSGKRSAESKRDLQALLSQERIIPTRIVEKRREVAIPKPIVTGRVSTKELAVFTRQFSVMIDAGLPLVQCLEILASQQENKAFARALVGVRSSLEAGSSLANALRQYPRIFDDLYTRMVEAGETGGILDTILQRLSFYIENDIKLRRKAKSTLIHPAVVVAGGVIMSILWRTVPIFAASFTGLGVEIPLPTRIAISLGRAVASLPLYLLAVLGLAVWGLKAYYSTPGGRMMIHTLILKTPRLGNLMQRIGVARFTRTLGTLITSGVPMLDAMDITARTSGNAVIEKAVRNVRRDLETGSMLVDALHKTGVFPKLVIHVIGVGEQTGNLDSTLEKIAYLYEQQLSIGHPQMGQMSDQTGDALKDANYWAFLRDLAFLESIYPGHMVAYTDGLRVALGRNAEELERNIPPQYQNCSLLIKNVPERVVKLRRPFRVVD